MTLLPEPDSPTIATALPRPDVERHATHGVNGPRVVAERDLEVADAQQRGAGGGIRSRFGCSAPG